MTCNLHFICLPLFHSPLHSWGPCCSLQTHISPSPHLSQLPSYPWALLSRLGASGQTDWNSLFTHRLSLRTSVGKGERFFTTKWMAVFIQPSFACRPAGCTDMNRDSVTTVDPMWTWSYVIGLSEFKKVEIIRVLYSRNTQCWINPTNTDWVKWNTSKSYFRSTDGTLVEIVSDNLCAIISCNCL